MGARMVPANGQTTKTKKIFYMSFWLERLSILLQIYTFACNFCSRKGGRASIGYRASIGTYTVGMFGLSETRIYFLPNKSLSFINKATLPCKFEYQVFKVKWFSC